MNIGLFFGSFNPIHTGHLVICNHILNTTSLEKIWLIVSPLNPFKKTSELLPGENRLKLTQAAVKSDDRLVASDIEFSLPRPSYTVNTLRHLEKTNPGDDFSLIMGQDNLEKLPEWKDSEYITKNYKIFIYNRLGSEPVTKPVENVTFLHAPLIEISSTQIRSLVSEGKSIKYLVPEKVREEIELNNFYKK